jgi:hypothetical protein
MAEPLRNDRPLSTADLADSRSRTNDSLAQDDLDARREGDPGGGPTLVHDRSVSGFVADESTSDLNALSSRDEQKMSALDRMDSSDNTRFDAASLSPTAARTATPTTEPEVAGLRPSGQPPQGGRPATNAAAETPLLSNSELSDLRSQWSNIQAEFVDEPRRSVQQADQLVATAMQRLAEGFANERATLEKQWDSGDQVSTEELRVALQRYRAFFGRLLNAA